LLDTACARVAVSQHAVPAELEDAQRHIEALLQELEIIERERTIGVEVDKRAARRTSHSAPNASGWPRSRPASARKKALVDQILGVRAKLREAGAVPADAASGASAPSPPPLLTEAGNAADSLADLRALEASLTELQGETPLILPSVGEQAVALVSRSGLASPPGAWSRTRLRRSQCLAIVESPRGGSRSRLEMISRRIQTARAGLENPGKPIGVFLLAGPSGVGKTETALALGRGMYGGEQNVITINMSEFQEAHTVSTLKGAPPGYVGYGEGGVLTEAVRRRPYRRGALGRDRESAPGRARGLLSSLRQRASWRTVRGPSSISKTRSSWPRPTWAVNC